MLVVTCVDPPRQSRTLWTTLVTTAEVDGHPIVSFTDAQDIRAAFVPSASLSYGRTMTLFGLNPARVPSSTTFGAQVLHRFGLTPTRVQNVSVVHPPAVLRTQFLAHSRFVNASTFGANKVGRWGLAPTTVVNNSTFGAPVLLPFGLYPTRFANVSVVYSPTMLPMRAVSQNRFVNVTTFGAHGIAAGGVRDIYQARVVNSSSFGAHSLSWGIDTTMVASTTTIGAQAVSSVLQQHRVVNTTSFGNPSAAIVVAPGYANLGGTGIRQGYIGVAWSGTTGGGTVQDLLDGSQSNSFWWAGGQTGKTLTFDFSAIGPQQITEMKWYQDSTGSHGTWKWQTSNDGTTFTDATSTFTLGGVTTQTDTSLSGNTGHYLYYRLAHVGITGTSSGPFLREIEFKLAVDAEPAPSVQSYLHPGGFGNRSSSITVTGTLTDGSGTGPKSNLVNGDYSNNTTGSWYMSNTQTAGNYVDFNFGSKRIVDEATWGTDNTTAMGTYKWQGGDGTTYSDIGSTFTLQGKCLKMTSLNGNTTPYQHYRLTMTAGSPSALPNNEEVHFRLDNVSHP